MHDFEILLDGKMSNLVQINMVKLVLYADYCALEEVNSGEDQIIIGRSDTTCQFFSNFLYSNRRTLSCVRN